MNKDKKPTEGHPDKAPEGGIAQEISAEDLEFIIENHKTWLESKGKEGQRALFSE
jgi:hypothetical protein